MNDADDAARTELEDVRALLESRGGALGLAAHLNEGIFEASGLDARTFFLVRAAAMAAMGSGPTAWAVNTELMDAEVTADELLGVLTAISPIIGTARMVVAAENIAAS
jgi:alkylhydroperoxidase/carboxymuconolactone decarboxylase family protein YurZ